MRIFEPQELEEIFQKNLSIAEGRSLVYPQSQTTELMDISIGETLLRFFRHEGIGGIWWGIRAKNPKTQEWDRTEWLPINEVII